MNASDRNGPPGGTLEFGSDEHSRASALVTMVRLHWFIRLRWLFLAGAVAVLAFERFAIPGTRRPMGLALVLGALGVVNLCWMLLSYVLLRQFQDHVPLRCGRFCRVEILANAQVAIDLFLLTCILHFVGGVESPLAMFYLFHVAIVSLLLPWWEAVAHACWALLLYASLVISELQGWLTPHYDFLPKHQPGLYDEPEYVIASLLVVACGIFGTLYFTLQIAQRLERRDAALRKANAALRQSQIAIQDLQRRRSRFMQTAAHQLKSPLAVIQTLTELIRCRIVPPEAVPGTCEKIINRCQEGIAQVSELLTLARVQEADPARHAAAEADVREVVRQLCERFGPVAQKKDVDLSCKMPSSGELRVRVEPRDLADCLGNLIENAIKYTPGPGKVDVTVTTTTQPDGSGSVTIEVADTGIGISPNILKPQDGEEGHEAVFDAFRRGDNAIAAGIPGTGLGLSIVQEIVEQAGGRIRVKSRPNEGSSFSVTFPTCGTGPAEPQIRDTRASVVVVEPPEGPASGDGA